MTKVMASSVLLNAQAMVGVVNLRPTKYNIWFMVALRESIQTQD